MNKDEMVKKQIEQMAEILFNAVGDAITFEQTSILGGSVKTDCFKLAETLYNANYREVSEDEIVIKKSVYDLEKAFYKEKCAEFDSLCYDYHKAKQETAREILKELYNSPHEYHENKIVKLANKYSIELE